jgi:hypothetical protein
VRNALDHVIHKCMNEPGLEFVWVGDDAIDTSADATDPRRRGDQDPRGGKGGFLGLGPTVGLAAHGLTKTTASPVDPVWECKPSVSELWNKSRTFS